MKYLYLFIIFIIGAQTTYAQNPDSLLINNPVKDSIRQKLNMDAIYNRPFMNVFKSPVSLGGYVESNWQHIGTDGVSEGHQFEFRRLSVFMASSISKRVKFLSEIEYEHNNEADEGLEINIEYAALDIELHPLFNLRSGIILNPIGAFNQNHDGPRWEFTDRPISATQLLPATFSNSGIGIYGKHYHNKWMIGYELYASGGFNNSIIDNEEGKTFLPAAKNSNTRYASIESGIPMITTKIAMRHRNLGEVGLSYMGGIYNRYMQDGLIIDSKRRLDVVAIDYNATINITQTNIVGEFTRICVQVPETYIQQYGNRQQGGFIDIIQPVVHKSILGWNQAVINLAARFEYVDWNMGKFNESETKIYDELWSIVPGISFRPTSQTVVRFNYRYLSNIGILGNPASKTGGFNLGFSSYF
jgi:hypothetical protein